MDRRAFVLGMLGAGVAAAGVAATAGEAEAAPLTLARPDTADEASRTEADYRPDVDGQPTSEEAQYYYVYRPRRRWRRRRVYYYRPRRRWRRRRYYRRAYYW